MANLGFHVTVNGPTGTTFPSFASSELMNGDPSKIVLSSIRKKCTISNKLFFTVDGKSPVSDGLTLEYYMSLTDEGTKVLLARNVKPKNESKPKANGDKNAGGEKKEEEADQIASGPSVASFTLNVAGKDSSPEPLLPLPVKNEALAKLMEGIGKSQLQLGKLPTFDNKELASLNGNYAAIAGGGDYVHPSNMKEGDWNRVLANNRALYGYCFDFSSKNAMRKAKKRAFKLRGRASIYEEPEEKSIESKANGTNGEGNALENEEQVAKRLLPPTPPFYVHDDATVNINETRNQYQSTLTKQGFNSRAIEFSLGGGAKGVAISAEASYVQEQSTASQSSDKTDVQSLIVTYNFPRVVIELDHESLELTEDCKRDAMNVTTKADAEKFYRDYGNIFVCSFGLGGFLQSTRNITSTEQSQLVQIKNSTRMSAGLSIQTPKVSAGFNYTKSSSDSTETGNASLQQQVQLAWDARGGDTVLCSNPPAWANTVKDFNLWRLMDQQQIVNLEGLIRLIDSVAWYQLENPSPQIPIGGDLTRAREILLLATMEPDKSALIQQMKSYYQDKKLDTNASIAIVNKFLQEKYPGDTEILLTPGLLFKGLSNDQIIGLGLYMIAKGDLKIV